MMSSRHETVVAAIALDIRGGSTIDPQMDDESSSKIRTSLHNQTTASVAIARNIEAGVLAQQGEPDRELVLLVWLATHGTEIAQAKARAKKSLLAKLCVERITQVSSRTNFFANDLRFS
jgi:hypothetical protein